jgi:hypothetical protein
VRPVDSIEAAIVAAAGIYGSSPTSHLGLAARLDGYAPADLERERLEERSIMRVPGMRGSVFLAPREIVPHSLALSRPERPGQTRAASGISDLQVERLTERRPRGAGASARLSSSMRAAPW